MTIHQVGSPIRASQMRTEFTTKAQWLSQYHRGAGIVPNGVTANNQITTSGPIAYSEFFGAEAKRDFYSTQGAFYYYNAQIGINIGQYNGGIQVSTGIFSNGSSGAAMTFGNTSNGWNQQMRFPVSTPNTWYYGYNNYAVKPGAIWGWGDSINTWVPGNWTTAAMWDGSNTIKVAMNYGMRSANTWDNGSSISLRNTWSSFMSLGNITRMDNGVPYTSTTVVSGGSRYRRGTVSIVWPNTPAVKTITFR